MTKRYAAIKLLEHGPLTMRELFEITGWGMKSLRSTIDWLRAQELVTVQNIDRQKYYRLP